MIKAQVDPEFFARDLFDAARRRARSYRMTFGSGAEHSIRQFAASAAARILQQPDGPVQDAQREAALAAFERLVDEMVSVRDAIPGYAINHVNVIGEQTLARALSKLCPLFPIC